MKSAEGDVLFGPVHAWYYDAPSVIRSQVDSAKYRSERTQNRLKTHGDPIAQTTFVGGLGHVWQHSYSSVNVNVSVAALKDRLLC